MEKSLKLIVVLSNVFRSRKQIFTLFWHYNFKQQQAFEIYLQYLQKYIWVIPRQLV